MRVANRSWVVLASVLMTSVLCQALDREAFTFTRYDLKVRVDPAKSGLAARGTVELRNDSTAPQSTAVLQISSTLQWRSIAIAGTDVQFLSQPYTSDVDHTGALTEAIVTLPKPIPPKSSVTLQVGYEGTIERNSGRLTRIGAPDKYARTAEWDEITASFTVVRGIGFVTWFPIAMSSVSLSDGNAVFEATAAWKERHRASTLQVALEVQQPAAPAPQLSTKFNTSKTASCTAASANSTCTSATFTGFHFPPTFAIAQYQTQDRATSSISYLPEHLPLARDYAAAIERWQPLIASWLGQQKEKVQIIELVEQGATSFDSGAFVFTPLRPTDKASLELAMAHAVAHTSFWSPRPWIYEGVAYFIQAVIRDLQGGRSAAIEYIAQFSKALAAAEKQELKPKADGKPSAGEPLVTTQDALFFRAKAAQVWWMLRDMVGEQELQQALQTYRPEQDTQAAYMQTLLETSAPGSPRRDLEWFFDDWVYRDRGLPDFRVDSAYPRKLLNGTYVVAITVENLGNAGAEVPVLVDSASGVRDQRVIVPAKGKGVVRISIAAAPTKVTVNDGSVPESDTTNNSRELKIATQ
jgi:hypothetical protein